MVRQRGDCAALATNSPDDGALPGSAADDRWRSRTALAFDGKVSLPKLGRPVNDNLSRYEVERIEDTARTERDKRIIRVFGDTGMRVGELVRLRTDDLLVRQRKLVVPND